MAKKKRREYTEEFNADAVRLVKKEGKSALQVARDLDLTPSALRYWIKQAEIDTGKGTEGALSMAEREELKRLRKENKQLMMEREILKKRPWTQPVIATLREVYRKEYETPRSYADVD